MAAVELVEAFGIDYLIVLNCRLHYHGFWAPVHSKSAPFEDMRYSAVLFG